MNVNKYIETIESNATKIDYPTYYAIVNQPGVEFEGVQDNLCGKKITRVRVGSDEPIAYCIARPGPREPTLRYYKAAK